MQQVLNQYRTFPTLKNAQKVRAYERRHMMASAMLTQEYSDLLADAIFHANSGEPVFE